MEINDNDKHSNLPSNGTNNDHKTFGIEADKTDQQAFKEKLDFAYPRLNNSINVPFKDLHFIAFDKK
jgi:hypothetical protein